MSREKPEPGEFVEFEWPPKPRVGKMIAVVNSDLSEPSLYSALHTMGELGDGATVRAGEYAIAPMTQINGHRHALGLKDIAFVPLAPNQECPNYWEVEVNGKIMCNKGSW